jgi:hypothetical protein
MRQEDDHGWLVGKDMEGKGIIRAFTRRDFGKPRNTLVSEPARYLQYPASLERYRYSNLLCEFGIKFSQ